MPLYDLDRLGPQAFEQLVQALAKDVIGSGSITFGSGPDGGREATFSGKSPYPSQDEQWDGQWVIQAKFHDTKQIGLVTARKAVLRDLRTELTKLVTDGERSCDNFILATNVPLTSVRDTGTHDKIQSSIIPDFDQEVPNIHVWGYDDIARNLDRCADIRRAYLHLITPGDILAELMDKVHLAQSDLAQAILLYVRTCAERDQFTQLDQAGEVDSEPVLLDRVFIDLDVKPRSRYELQSFVEDDPQFGGDPRSTRDPTAIVSATSLLIDKDAPRCVLIGGPG